MQLTFDSALVVDAAGIAVMVFGLVELVRLRGKIPGGVVALSWKVLTALVSLFTLAYIGTPFMGSLPADSLRMVVAVIFLFGALYVLTTVILLHRILEALA